MQKDGQGKEMFEVQSMVYNVFIRDVRVLRSPKATGRKETLEVTYFSLTPHWNVKKRKKETKNKWKKERERKKMWHLQWEQLKGM